MTLACLSNWTGIHRSSGATVSPCVRGVFALALRPREPGTLSDRTMAVNGRLLTVDDREDLWAAGWEQLPREKAAATLLIFNDRKATLDSLHQFLHAPRKAPVKDAIKCIVAKEIRIDLPHLIQTLSDCKDATSLILEKRQDLVQACGGGFSSCCA